MGDMYDHNHNNKGCSDDISLFLRQILLPSSPTTSSSPVLSRNVTTAMPLGTGSSAFHGYASSTTLNLSSSSFAASDNEAHDYDCDAHALAEETARSVPSRSSSKRTRAAEVHNLSEKRRRNRINEKMKALQNLIPNSNKSDKVSMLDDAIEYLKQLQVQVQILSLRNGLSLQSMCLPEALQSNQLSRMRMRFGEESGSLHLNMAGTLSVDPEISAGAIFSRPDNQSTSSQQPSVTNVPNLINSEISFGLESSMHPHPPLFSFRKSSEEMCRVRMSSHQISDIRHE